MASVNYSGRSVDLFIFQGAIPAGESRISLSFGDNGGEVITGIQKLVQTFTIMFLTERGTVKGHDDVGTEFVTAVRQGRILDEADVKSEFLVASELIQQKLDLEADANALPEDEQLLSTTLLDYTIDRGASKLTMKVRITSVAGESREVFLPVPIAIQ